MLFLYCFREPSTSKSVMAANVLEAESELVKENTEIIQQLCGQVTEKMLTEAKSELQVLAHSFSTFTKFPLVIYHHSPLKNLYVAHTSWILHISCTYLLCNASVSIFITSTRGSGLLNRRLWVHYWTGK